MALVGFPAILFAHGNSGGKALQLEVNGDETALTTRHNSECVGHPNRPDMPEKGCFRFAKGKWDNVRFRLDRKTCRDGGDQYLWELDRVELAGVNATAKPTFGGRLDPVAVRDFNADPATGQVIYVENAPARDISIKNRNAALEPYSVWYRVRATCNGKNPIYFDPRFDNEGNP
jgi:hypothetical protein